MSIKIDKYKLLSVDENICLGGHHIMEFFEMCAALITELAR